MAIKHIYFVRHGETLANRTHTHQSSDEPLSPKGRAQAHRVALRLPSMEIDTLICSTYTRARETATIIGEELKLPFTTSHSLVEIKRPDHLYGQQYYSPDTLRYFVQLFMNRENENWLCNGAENMFTLRNRIADAKTLLMHTEGETIAVVSHDIFMNLFLAHVCREKKLTFKEFIHILLRTKKTPNTGMIHFMFDNEAPKGVCAWQLIETIDPAKGQKT
jgi:broad specificity phosphatase PhoE